MCLKSLLVFLLSLNFAEGDSNAFILQCHISCAAVGAVLLNKTSRRLLLVQVSIKISYNQKLPCLMLKVSGRNGKVHVVFRRIIFNSICRK